jgi:hypothetical protein
VIGTASDGTRGGAALTNSAPEVPVTTNVDIPVLSFASISPAHVSPALVAAGQVAGEPAKPVPRQAILAAEPWWAADADRRAAADENAAAADQAFAESTLDWRI